MAVKNICHRCQTIFSEPGSQSYCYEEYNGVADLFGDRHYGSYEVCPECGSEEFDPFTLPESSPAEASVTVRKFRGSNIPKLSDEANNIVRRLAAGRGLR